MLHTEPVAPRLLNPSVPRDLETICLKCLEKEPARRYPTAQALAEELNRFLRGEPIVARPLGMTGRVWRWSRRKPQAASLAAVAILTFLLGFAGVLWQLQLKESQRQRAETGEQFALQIACAADMNQAQLSLEEGDYGRAVSLLEKYLPRRQKRSPNATDLRQWEWRYLWQLCQSDDWFTLCRYTNTWIGGLAVSPDGNVLAVQKGDGVALWDLPGKRPLKELPASGRRGAMAFSPVGSLLAAANCDDTGHAEVTLWDANTGVAKPPLPHPVFVRSLSFSGDGKLLATMDSKLTIRVWEVESQSEITNFVTSSNTVGRLVRLSPDGSRLAFGDLNGGVRVLNSRTGTTCLEIPAPDPKDGQVTAIAFSPDGHILAWAVGLRMVIRLCDSETGQLRGELVGHKDWVLSLAFTPNSELLASASGDQTVRVWNIADNTVRCRLQGHLNEAWAVAFMKDGKTLISGGKDGCVRFWDVSAPHGARWPVPIPARCLAFTTNSQQFVALGQPDGSVSVWDGLSLQPIEPLPALGSNNSSVALSPDGRWLAIGDVAGNVKTWDWPARRAVTNLVYPSRVITILGFSPGGRYLWAGVQRGEILTRTGGAARALKVWQTHSWEEIQLNGIETVGVRWADFSPDDRLLALSYEDGTVKLWSLSDGKLVAALSGHSPRVERVLFSPNGWILASAGYDDFVKLWDVHKRRELMTLRSHFNHLSALAFSPDGQRLAVAGYGPNVAIKLWEPAIQRELITLEFNKRAVSPSYIIAFSPDGNTLASAVPFGPVLLWRAPSFAEIEARERKESPR